MRKFPLGLTLCALLLAACGGGGGGGGSASSGSAASGNLVTAPSGSALSGDQVTPLTAAAATLGELPPDQEPAPVAVANETDSLNPADGVVVTAQAADSEPLAVGALPGSSDDPEKPNS